MNIMILIYYDGIEVYFEGPPMPHFKGKKKGNWEGEAKFKTYFSHGGAIDFAKALMKAATLASQNRHNNPPSYSAAMAGSIYPAPAPAYSPPLDPYYSWVPYASFPSAPPQNSVYMTEAPPPYPGVHPGTTSSSPAPNSHDSKAREAAASAYYNPADPHTMYATAPPPSDAFSAPPYPADDPPPSYDQHTKKDN